MIPDNSHAKVPHDPSLMKMQDIYDKTDFLIGLQEFDVNRGIRLFQYAVKRKLRKMAKVLSERLWGER